MLSLPRSYTICGMTKQLKVPKFQREADEAKWWDSHQSEVADEFERATAEDRVPRGTAVRQARSLQEKKRRSES